MTTAEILNQMEKELGESLKTRITEAYFVHCKPKDRPEFKDLAEAEVWYKQQNYIAEKIVGNWVDDTIAFLRSPIRTLLESFGEEIIGEDETEVNRITRDEKLGVQTYYVITANMKRRNQLRAEQRLKVKEIISSIGK